MWIRRSRPRPGAISWSAIATPTRSVARRIFRRPRQEKSAAEATDFPARRQAKSEGARCRKDPQEQRRRPMTSMRKETDSLGVVEVAADKLWGAQTQRSLEHFSIGKDLIPDAEMFKRTLGLSTPQLEHF